MERAFIQRAVILCGAAVAGAAAVATGCQPSATVAFAGTEHPPRVAPDALARVAAGRAPEGHAIIGVVTAQCTTVNEASGLLDEPCHEEALTRRLRERAANAGGTALQDLACRQGHPERRAERGDAGLVETSVTETTTCQATVLRGAAPLPSPAASGGRRVEVGGVQLRVHFEGRRGSPRDASEIGELDRFPRGYEERGRVEAACERGCARATARLALQREAARAGGIAIAETQCEPLGDRWRCEARVVGAAVDAGSDDAESLDASVADERQDETVRP